MRPMTYIPVAAAAAASYIWGVLYHDNTNTLMDKAGGSRTKLRNWAGHDSGRPGFFRDLLRCAPCTSMWISTFVCVAGNLIFNGHLTKLRCISLSITQAASVFSIYHAWATRKRTSGPQNAKEQLS